MCSAPFNCLSMDLTAKNSEEKPKNPRRKHQLLAIPLTMMPARPQVTAPAATTGSAVGSSLVAGLQSGLNVYAVQSR